MSCLSTRGLEERHKALLMVDEAHSIGTVDVAEERTKLDSTRRGWRLPSYAARAVRASWKSESRTTKSETTPKFEC